MQTIYINGNDSRSQYGIVFTASAVNALLAPPPLKAYVTNKSRAEHGKRITGGTTRYDERDVTLEIYLEAPDWATFTTRRAAMMTLFQSMVTVVIGDESSIYYRLYYLSCSQFTQFNGRIARFQVKFNEPNPNNRAAPITTT